MNDGDRHIVSPWSETPQKKRSSRERVRDEMAQAISPPVSFTLSIQRGEVKTDIREEIHNRHELRETLNRILRVIDGLALDPSMAALLIQNRLVSLSGISFGGMTFWDDALLALAQERALVEVHFSPTHPGELEVYHRGCRVCTARCVHRASKG